VSGKFKLVRALSDVSVSSGATPPAASSLAASVAHQTEQA
jgi:hypothetical protein